MRASAATARAVQRLLPELRTSAARAQRPPFFTLGLDVSSSFTGYTVLTPTGRLVRCDAIDLRKRGSVLEAAGEVERQLRVLRDTVAEEAGRHFPAIVTTTQGPGVGYAGSEGDADCGGGGGDGLISGSGCSSGTVPWVVAIEDFMKSFGRASFQTQGLFKLAQLNGIVAYQCGQIFLQQALPQQQQQQQQQQHRRRRRRRQDQGGGGGDGGGAAAEPAAPETVPGLLQTEPRMIMPNAIRAFHGLKAESAPRRRRGTAHEGANGEQGTAEDAAVKAKAAAEWRKKRKDIKRVVWERAAEELPEDLWGYGARGGFLASNYDMADSYFTAKFMLKEQLQQAMLSDEELLAAVEGDGDQAPATAAALVDRFLFEGHHLEPAHDQ